MEQQDVKEEVKNPEDFPSSKKEADSKKKVKQAVKPEAIKKFAEMQKKKGDDVKKAWDELGLV